MSLLVANWKMNGTRADVAAYAAAVNAALEAAPANVEVVFCPPTIYSDAARAALPANAKLKVGAQNCHHEPKGAFTGEISAAMLKDSGVSHVILGHSERRASGETDAQIAAKAAAAIHAGLMPIICVGESLADYEAGCTKMVLDTQVAVLKNLAFPPSHPASRPKPAAQDLRNGTQDPVLTDVAKATSAPQDDFPLIIAYEPIWAIGTGKTPKSKEIEAAHTHIKTLLGSEAVVLYGGSVTPANLGEILKIKGVGGALIGGASLTIEGMLELIQLAKG